MRWVWLFLFISFNVFSFEEEEHLVSPFRATVIDPTTHKPVTLWNTNRVHFEKQTGGLVYRSQGPYKNQHYRDLRHIGVERILVFRDIPENALERETNKLKGQGIREILHVPFFYFGFEDAFFTPCEKTVGALIYLQRAVREGKRALIHCTVGEDRTGYLSGLFRLLQEKKPSQKVRTIFKNELCERGYGRGNGRKPDFVVENIRRDLTPLFLKMTYLILTKQLTLSKLNVSEEQTASVQKAICKDEPGHQLLFQKGELLYRAHPDYTCAVSSRYNGTIPAMEPIDP